MPSRARRARPTASRARVVSVVAVVLLAGGLLDRIGAHGSASAQSSSRSGPAVAPAQALSSSWFCAGATDGGSVAAPGRLVVANGGPSPVSGVVTIISSRGSSAERVVPVQIGGYSRQVVLETVPGGAPWVGAIVDMDAGGVAVSEEIDGGLGYSAAPCATSGSTQWYFVNGQTLINAGEELSLINPYPTDSVVDLSFTTDQGIEQPQDFQGLVVPGEGMLNVDLGEHLRRRRMIAVSISVRTGRVVAWKTDWTTQAHAGSVLLGTPASRNPLSDPASPVPGVSVSLGAPAAGTTWTWADGLAGSGVDERYVIYNPGPTTAEVRLSLGLDQGVAEPFDLSVGPYQVLPVVSEQQARIPAGTAHWAVLQSTNGVPVVASRVVAARPPSSWSGIGELLGARAAASEWLIPTVIQNRYHDSWIVLLNPGSVPVRTTIYGIEGSTPRPLTGLESVLVAAGRRVAIHLVGVLDIRDEPITLSSTGPLFVESDSYGSGRSSGVSLSLGVPFGP
jgi:Family of unknown function (DUF5719)